MVELYTDLKGGLWRVVMQQDNLRGRVEHSRTGMSIDWHLGVDGGILLHYPDTFENFVPKYVTAQIASMSKLAYQWHSQKRTGTDYGHCTVSDEDIDSLVETHGYEYTAAEIAELKARKEELTEIAVKDIMEFYWMEAVGEATVSLLHEEITE